MALFRLWLTWDLSSRMESSLRSRARIRSVSFGCVPWAKDIAKRKFKRLSPARTCTNQKAALPRLLPEQFQMLIDIQAKMAEGKTVGYEKWAKKFNRKEAARTVILLKEKGLGNYDDLNCSY